MADVLQVRGGGKKSVPTPLVQAGWLTKGEAGESDYVIEVCDFAKIEYRIIIALADSRGIRSFRPERKQTAKQKYEAWGDKPLDVQVNVTWTRPNVVKGLPMLSQYGTATTDGGSEPARLVFTGQPQDNPRFERTGKHHDFVFINRQQPEVVAVPKRIMEDFRFGHSNRGQQNKLGQSTTPNEEWGYWKPQLDRGARVPVFFLTEPNGELRAFGLAMMFRLAYRQSIGQAVERVNPDHRKLESELDFAEGLFGTVRQSSGQRSHVQALRGRVGISHAVAQGDPQPANPVTVILGAPKASYYPNYIEQPARIQSSEAYLTWMDTQAKPRGWKRYIPKDETWHPPIPPKVNMKNVGTPFRPLPAATVFKADVDVHNLRPEELGALIWAIEWGGDEQARHTLGMARPLGYGRCRMTVEDVKLTDMRDQAVDAATCHRAFVHYMQEQIPNWARQTSIVELLALARIQSADATRHQTLSPNQFVAAKKDGLALPYAAGAVQEAMARGQALVAENAGIRLHILSQRTTVSMVGIVAELDAWLQEQKAKEASARDKMADIEQEWFEKLVAEPAPAREAAINIIRSNITKNSKTKAWLEITLPERLNL